MPYYEHIANNTDRRDLVILSESTGGLRDISVASLICQLAAINCTAHRDCLDQWTQPFHCHIFTTKFARSALCTCKFVNSVCQQYSLGGEAEFIPS